MNHYVTTSACVIALQNLRCAYARDNVPLAPELVLLYHDESPYAVRFSTAESRDQALTQVHRALQGDGATQAERAWETLRQIRDLPPQQRQDFLWTLAFRLRWAHNSTVRTLKDLLFALEPEAILAAFDDVQKVTS